MHNFGEKFGESPFWISRISVLRDCRIEAAKAVPEIILSSIFNPLSYQSRWFVKTLALSGLLFKALCNTTIVGQVVRTGHTAISHGLIIDRGCFHNEFLVKSKIQKLKTKMWYPYKIVFFVLNFTAWIDLDFCNLPHDLSSNFKS